MGARADAAASDVRRLDPPGRHRVSRRHGSLGDASVRRDPRRPSGVTFTVDDYDETMRRLETPRRQVSTWRSRRCLAELDGLGVEAASVSPTERATFPLVLVGRRAPLVDGQHDPPRSGMAQEGSAGCAAGVARRRRTPRLDRRRSGAGHDQARHRRSPSSRSPTRCCAGHITLPNGFGLGRRWRSSRRGRRGAERADLVGRSRLVRRHAAPQARARPRRASRAGAASS